MSGDETPIFKADTQATLVSDLAAPAPDPRRAKVSAVHKQIVAGVKDGSIYRDETKKKRR